MKLPNTLAVHLTPVWDCRSVFASFDMAMMMTMIMMLTMIMIMRVMMMIMMMILAGYKWSAAYWKFELLLSICGPSLHLLFG